ncbi:hypothetical protein [Rufibacter sp. LB8]|uniref:hypothetical protein n=1 Tax=Rufibacter sp. LB8 TaxID=2777781 RepID=UPI00178C6E2C|nr:hypothetical protein [Rufibacter sp. LB8]
MGEKKGIYILNGLSGTISRITNLLSITINITEILQLVADTTYSNSEAEKIENEIEKIHYLFEESAETIIQSKINKIELNNND